MGDFEDRLRRAEPRSVPTDGVTERATARARDGVRGSRRAWLRPAVGALATTAAVGAGLGTWWLLADEGAEIRIIEPGGTATASADRSRSFDVLPTWGVEAVIATSDRSEPALARLESAVASRADRLGWPVSISRSGGEVVVRVPGAGLRATLEELLANSGLEIFDATTDLIAESADPGDLGLDVRDTPPTEAPTGGQTDFLISPDRRAVVDLATMSARAAVADGTIFVRLPAGQRLVVGGPKRTLMRFRGGPVVDAGDTRGGRPAGPDAARLILTSGAAGRLRARTPADKVHRLVVTARSPLGSAAVPEVVGETRFSAHGPVLTDLELRIEPLAGTERALADAVLRAGDIPSVSSVDANPYGPQRERSGPSVPNEQAFIASLPDIDGVSAARAVVESNGVRVVALDDGFPGTEYGLADDRRFRLTRVPSICALSPGSPHFVPCQKAHRNRDRAVVFGPVGPLTRAVEGRVGDQATIEGTVRNGWFVLIVPADRPVPESVVALDGSGMVLAKRAAAAIFTGSPPLGGRLTAPPSAPTPEPAAPPFTTPADPPPTPTLPDPPPAPPPPTRTLTQPGTEGLVTPPTPEPAPTPPPAPPKPTP